MLRFRAVNDYKGVHYGEVWDLERWEEVPRVGRYTVWTEDIFTLVREIDDMRKQIALTGEELGQHFDWLKMEGGT